LRLCFFLRLETRLSFSLQIARRALELRGAFTDTCFELVLRVAHGILENTARDKITAHTEDREGEHGKCKQASTDDDSAGQRRAARGDPGAGGKQSRFGTDDRSHRAPYVLMQDFPGARSQSATGRIEPIRVPHLGDGFEKLETPH